MRANAGSTIAGKHRQTKCRQKGTGGKTEIRHISAANNYPLRQHTFARIFSYTENKISGMQPLYSRRLRRRPLSYISHLTGRHFAGHYRHLASSCFAGISISLPAVLPPATLFLKALPALHQPQLPSSAFRNPKMHPHQQAFHQYQAPRH